MQTVLADSRTDGFTHDADIIPAMHVLSGNNWVVGMVAY